MPIKPSLIIANKQLETDIPYIIVFDTKAVLSQIAHNFFKKPSQQLNIIATTGTDGKTTTAYVLKQLLDLYQEAAYIGTNGFITNYYILPTTLTTPKPITLHRYLRRCVNDGIGYVALEASSQGLAEKRLNDVEISRAIFTNLTHEHLDYHQTMEQYFHSKLTLFQKLKPQHFAIVNLDEREYAEQIIAHTKAQVITYGRDPEALFHISEIKTSLYQTTFSLKTPNQTYHNIHLNLFGDYNVYNVVACLAVLYSYGFDLTPAINHLCRLKPIEGRMKIVKDLPELKIIVDFAHTPNALNALLKNLRESFPNHKLTIVFGSAGERDRLKRPLMGAIVDQYCDKIFLTNEDPKGEEPLAIIHDLYRGIKNPFKTEIILSRKNAIHKALLQAEKDEIILITGKGNENVQVFKNYKLDHNDIQVTLDLLSHTFLGASLQPGH